MTYQQWCRWEGVMHAHCPCECEHPQPFVSDGVLYCGRCAAIERRETRMVPCTPDICEQLGGNP
jgi:hypothetical protein